MTVMPPPSPPATAGALLLACVASACAGRSAGGNAGQPHVADGAREPDATVVGDTAPDGSARVSAIDVPVADAAARDDRTAPIDAAPAPGAPPDAAPARSAGPAFYVSPDGDDAADGSAARPWRTIQRAANGVRPGVTVHVAPGRYASGAIQARIAGTASARIRFVSDTRWGARIYVSPVSSYHYAWVQDGGFTDIEGFDVSGDGFTGINMRGPDVRVVGNHIHDFPNVGSGGAGGVLVENGKRAVIADNVVHHIGSQKSSLIHGIYLSAGSDGAVVQNNIVFSNSAWGIHSYHTSTNATISNNLVFGNQAGGIIIGGPEAGDDQGIITDYFTVANNIVVYNGGSAFSETSNMKGTHNRYLNNLVWGSTASAFSFFHAEEIRGTVTAVPRFVDFQPDGSGDYHLAVGSPAIDAGTATGAPAVDRDGTPRPYGAASDIGPYEWRP
jgi:parallel beta-helix repeat protein